MSTRTDLYCNRGADYSETIVFGTSQDAYTFEAELDDYPVISYDVTQSGASVTIGLTDLVTAELYKPLYRWRLLRTLSTDTEVTHSGNFFVNF